MVVGAAVSLTLHNEMLVGPGGERPNSGDFSLAEEALIRLDLNRDNLRRCAVTSPCVLMTSTRCPEIKIFVIFLEPYVHSLVYLFSLVNEGQLTRVT